MKKVVVVPVLHGLAEAVFADLSLNELGNWLLAANIWVLLGIIVVLGAVLSWLCVKYIPHNRVGVVEKLWSGKGSLSEGCILALNGEAGYQARLLRGGLHFGYWKWQYRIHKVRLVTIPQSEMGYVYARDGEPLSPSQTLGRVAPCNNFQDATAFLAPSQAALIAAERVESDGGQQVMLVKKDEHDLLRGQRGRQRAILREGVYAINPAQFVVITANNVFALSQAQEPHEHTAVSPTSSEV